MTTGDAMESATSATTPSVTMQGDVPDPAIEAALGGAAAAPVRASVIEIAGPGAVQCMQGLLTADLERAGDRSFAYGAILTPKGMIVSDLWVSRDADLVTLFVPMPAADQVLAILRRSLPPRLARCEDRSTAWELLRVAGPQTEEVMGRTDAALPDAGRIAPSENAVIAAPADAVPFGFQIQCRPGESAQWSARLRGSGAVMAETGVLEIPRVLAGWPLLGAEIGHKTLVQEARIDELGGVSYTKGCYIGQETVSRLHFRGHANKRVLGLRWEADPDPSRPEVEVAGRDVGHITTVTWLGPRRGYAGLGMIRREIEPGQRVTACGAEAHTVSLPHQLQS